VKHEYEAKFLSIDVADLQAKLTALGAVQAFPRTPAYPENLRERRTRRRRVDQAARRRHSLHADT
jgi:hypothetical protein